MQPITKLTSKIYVQLFIHIKATVKKFSREKQEM